MDKNKLWIIGAVLVMVIIFAGGWALGIQPQLSAASLSASQLATVTTTNQNSALALAKLKSDYSRLPQLQAQLAGLQQSVPSGTEFPTVLNEFNAMAAASGVTLTGWNFSPAEPYAPVIVTPPAVAAPPSSSSSSTATPTPAPSATAAPAVASPAEVAAAGAPAYSNPAITAGNFVVIPTTIDAKGTYAQTIAFVKQLQSATRLILVTGVSTSAPSGSGLFNETVNGLMYVLPSAATTGTTPAG